jgi:uncharacterized protein (TIGR03083 family)
VSDRKLAIQEKLSAEREALLSFLEGLGQEDWTRPTANDPWTVRDLLAHLVGAELSQHGLIHMWLEGKTSMHPQFDLVRWNAGQLNRREGRNVSQLLADLSAARRETLALLDRLAEQELDIMGEHPFWGQDSSIEHVLRGIYRHERLHLEDMRKAVNV